jgi:hypothetical protein
MRSRLSNQLALKLYRDGFTEPFTNESTSITSVIFTAQGESKSIEEMNKNDKVTRQKPLQ